MIKVLFVNAKGEIEKVVDPSAPQNYPNLDYDEDGYYCIHVDLYTDVAALIDSSYWDFEADTWLPRETRPSHNHKWENKAWVLDNEMLWKEIRFERNNRLKYSDWTQLEDAPPGKKGQYAAYRQALRDVPANQPDVNFVTDIIWPEEPV